MTEPGDNMRVIIGMVGVRTGKRIVLSARATPTLRSIVSLTPGDGSSPSLIDWGQDAEPEARERLAAWILSELSSVPAESIPGRHITLFARNVIQEKLDSGKMFILDQPSVESWLSTLPETVQ